MVKIYRGLRQDISIPIKYELTDIEKFKELDIEMLNIYQLALTYTPEAWKDIFIEGLPHIQQISKAIDAEEEEWGKCLPPRKYIFRTFHTIAPEDVKVLIVGESPYHLIGVETGMAFNNWSGDKKQISVQNIHNEILRCYPDFKIPRHGNISPWISQGVMLLNATLTVRKGKKDSMIQTWMGFISLLITRLVALHGKKLVVMIWGAKAQVLVKDLVGSASVLETSNPGHFTVDRGFKGCNHFIKCNEILKKYGREEINWCQL